MSRHHRDQWHPLGATNSWCPPEVGQFIAYDHAVYRVVEVRAIPEDRWTEQQRQRFGYTTRGGGRRVPMAVVVRPAHITSDDVRARDHDLHLVEPTPTTEWHVYPDEHYPVCRTCQEPVPCREKHGQRIAEREMAHISRYENPGVCPACGEVVTDRQGKIRFHDNVIIPGGPPLVFHTRRQCYGSAVEYERSWAAAAPSRERRLSCDGNLIVHNDGTYECSTGVDCPGAGVVHMASRSTCSCPECHANGVHHLGNLSPNARNRAVNAADEGKLV